MAKKAAKTTAKAAAAPVEEMQAAPGGATVRMYRQGLGDCFLLAFPRAPGDRPFYMLIDCGVIVGQKNRPGIAEVADHVRRATGGAIDLLVVTHEHWDHLSGFIAAEEIFRKQIKIGQVWLPWTESDDPLAAKLRVKKEKTEKALRGMAARLGAAALGAADGRFRAAFDNVLGFLGAGKTKEALEIVKELGSGKPEFCFPSDAPRTLPGVKGVRVYVLGPPHDEVKIKRHSDRKTDPQTYRLAALGLEALTDFLSIASEEEPADPGVLPKYPFDARLRIQKKEARCQKRFAELHKRSFGGPDKWRAIDCDWIRAASGLALHLDNATNNTSLALAIELENGKVLLFPGDAQVGNWLSWHDQTWPDGAGGRVSAEDLLSRTAVYKVGHHCSHNATLKQRGLELMTNPDLVALSPLDRVTAKAKEWPMPWPSLRRGLLEATQGRILQVDDKKLPDGRERPKNTPLKAWKKFQESVRGDNFYFEIAVR